jgi:thiamine pyrophosphate-dependent acetolactate synthase large subunit-like protein
LLSTSLRLCRCHLPPCHQADLLIALGVRFDDRVTGKLEAFAQHARIVHIDIDPAEIDKNKTAHIPICAGAAAVGPSMLASWLHGRCTFDAQCGVFDAA